MNVHVRRKLNQARLRLVVSRFLHHAAWALLAALTGTVILRLWEWGGPRGWLAALPWLASVSLVAAAAAAAVRWRSAEAVARELDARAGTRDRFLTALRLRAAPEWEEPAQREIAAFAREFDLRSHFHPPGAGRHFLWLLAPLAALAVLEGLRHVRLEAVADQRAAARDLIAETRRLAEQHPETARAAAELAEVEKALAESAEPLREAMRALAELERSFGPAPSLSAAEAAALAEALASEAPALSSQLRQGENGAAARSVAGMDPAALARALEEAGRHVEERRLEELARSRDPREELTMILQEGNGAGGAQRKKFLSALRDLKQGGGERKGDGEGGEGEQSGESSGRRNKPGTSLADNAPPGGAPGSERDRGRGGDLGREGNPLRDTEGPEELVAGQVGEEGASLIEMFRASGGDDPAARRAWKSAWQAAAPAQIDAVTREDIPPGSRLMVKRYFESIRPPE